MNTTKDDALQLVDIEARLIESGMNPLLAHQVTQANVISNYSTLLRAFNQLPYASRTNMIDPWQPLCMSGEIAALQYSAERFNLRANTIDHLGRTPLHFIALAGTWKYLDNAIQLLDIKKSDLQAKDIEERGLIHYAAWNTSRCMLTHVIHQLKQIIPQRDKLGRTIAHYAALSGSPKKLNQIIVNFDRDIFVKDSEGSGLQHYAALSNTVSQLQFVNHLHIPMDARDDKGRSILHFAAMSNELSQLLAIIEFFGNDLHERDHDGLNIMHYAALSGINEKLGFIVNDLSFDPTECDHHGRNAMHYAAWSGVLDQIDYAVLELALDPNLTDAAGNTAFWYALHSPTHFFANNRIRECLHERDIAKAVKSKPQSTQTF